MTLTELLFADDSAAVAIDKQRGHRESRTCAANRVGPKVESA